MPTWQNFAAIVQYLSNISTILKSFFSPMMPLYLWHGGQQSKLKCNEYSLSMNIHFLFECCWMFSWYLWSFCQTGELSFFYLHDYFSSSEVWRETSDLQQMAGQALQIRVNFYGGWRISIWTFLPYGSAVTKEFFMCKSVSKFNCSFLLVFFLFAILGAQLWKFLREIHKMLSIFIQVLFFPWIHYILITIEGNNTSELDVT